MHCSIAVVDDSAPDRAYITTLAAQWADAAGHQVSVAEFDSAEAFLRQYALRPDCDILLLDIEMGDMDGVTMAKRLRRENETVQIIFITGYSDYIAEGYEVAALHYLMKPVQPEKLSAVLTRAAEKLARDEKTLSCDLGGAVERVPVYRIRWAEVQGNYVTIHADADLTVRMTLSELEAALDARFHRVSRFVLVNLTQISRVTRSEIRLCDGTAIPLPRGAYDAVNRAIIDRHAR